MIARRETGVFFCIGNCSANPSSISAITTLCCHHSAKHINRKHLLLHRVKRHDRNKDKWMLIGQRGLEEGKAPRIASSGKPTKRDWPHARASAVTGNCYISISDAPHGIGVICSSQQNSRRTLPTAMKAGVPECNLKGSRPTFQLVAMPIFAHRLRGSVLFAQALHIKEAPLPKLS